nr:MAG TPA: hypothetical protein [Caudoviricetes sp.]
MKSNPHRRTYTGPVFLPNNRRIYISNNENKI